SSQKPEAQSNPAREALVLDALRSLVRATAREIAQHTGLPNGTANVLLRSLVAAKRVAKTDTLRGVEYSLMSNGSIQPFKRAKAVSVACGLVAATLHDGEHRGAAAAFASA